MKTNQQLIRVMRPGLILLASLSLFACNQPAQDPKTVAEKYWLYLQNDNAKEAEKLVTTNSRQDLSSHADRITPQTQVTHGNTRTTVTTTITTTDAGTGISHSETFETTLVLEQGQWKVDIAQSPIPPAPTAREEQMQQMTEELSESMQENIESLDQAMEQGMELFNDAMHEGSKEMGDSLLKLMNELNRSMKDSIEQMKQRRQRQQEKQQDPAKPDPRKGEGMI